MTSKSTALKRTEICLLEKTNSIRVSVFYSTEGRPVLTSNQSSFSASHRVPAWSSGTFPIHESAVQISKLVAESSYSRFLPTSFSSSFCLDLTYFSPVSWHTMINVVIANPDCDSSGFKVSLYLSSWSFVNKLQLDGAEPIHLQAVYVDHSRNSMCDSPWSVTHNRWL